MAEPTSNEPTEDGQSEARKSESVPALSAEQLPTHIREALAKANLKPQEMVIIEAAFQMSRSQWPPPDVVDGYERAVPGMGKTIIDAINARIAARTAREDLEAERADVRMQRGQTFGFGIALGSLILAGVLGVYGAGWIAMVIGVVGLIVGIGGPSVARVMADKVYLDMRSQQSQRRTRTSAPAKKT